MTKQSIWQSEKTRGVFTTSNNISKHKKDVIIIGGGITSLLCAYNLLKSGVNKVSIFEKHQIGSGTTAGTTAKITSQHSLIYAKLLKSLGNELALDYANSNQLAIDEYETLISSNSIDCDFQRKNCFLYTLDDLHVGDLEEEAFASSNLGIHSRFEQSLPLPLDVKGAVRFTDQAQFHPLKFVNALADMVVSLGGEILEHTEALTFDNHSVTTAHGVFDADHIVICTHYPLLNKKGGYFLKLFQTRSYAMALKLAQHTNIIHTTTPRFEGMYRDIDDRGLSFRWAKGEDGDDLLLLGGLGHKTGHKGSHSHYNNLQNTANQLFPGGEIVSRWSAQDCMTHDSVPYIGRFHQDYPNLYVATGFNKWGMTSAMVASGLIGDLIRTGKSNYADVYNPQRKDLSLSIASFAKETLDITANLALGYLTPRTKKQPAANTLRITARCRHMGSALHYNKDENSWDCPAHGSRFDAHGQVLEGPAVTPLTTSAKGILD